MYFGVLLILVGFGYFVIFCWLFWYFTVFWVFAAIFGILVYFIVFYYFLGFWEYFMTYLGILLHFVIYLGVLLGLLDIWCFILFRFCCSFCNLVIFGVLLCLVFLDGLLYLLIIDYLMYFLVFWCFIVFSILLILRDWWVGCCWCFDVVCFGLLSFVDNCWFGVGIRRGFAVFAIL